MKEKKRNEKLIAFFKDCGMSKYAVSKKSGISLRTLYNWIDCVSKPTLENMEALAEACSVPFETIRNLFK